MPAGPVGTVWTSGVWADTVWEDGVWGDAAPTTTSAAYIADTAFLTATVTPLYLTATDSDRFLRAT